MRNQKGQTVLEYVLLMLVIVVTLGSIMLAFSKSTQAFITNYYGAYFQCLLETGELPSLGNENNPNSECQDSFQAFTFTAGRPPVNNSVNSANNSNSNASNANSDNANANGANANGGAGKNSGATGSEGFGSDSNGKVPLTGADGAGSGKTDDGGGRPQFHNYAQSGGEDGDDEGKKRFVPAGDLYNQKKDQDKPKTEVVARKDNENANDGSPRRVPANLDRKPEKPLEKEEGLTLPNFFKYLLIISIILALVIFFGNQVMSFSKSQGD